MYPPCLYLTDSLEQKDKGLTERMNDLFLNLVALPGLMIFFLLTKAENDF